MYKDFRKKYLSCEDRSKLTKTCRKYDNINSDSAFHIGTMFFFYFGIDALSKKVASRHLVIKIHKHFI